MTHATALSKGRRFMLEEARLLERRVMATLFDREDAAGALDALAGYRNDDGGFGHALEPDKRTPASQPLDVECAFAVMEAVGRVDAEMVLGACEFLRSLGPGVGCLTPSALEGPRAPHWGDFALSPSLNPTAGIVSHLWRWEIDHPWRDEATAFCWGELERGLPQDAHTYVEVLRFLEAVPERDRADALVGPLAGELGNLALFRMDPASTAYGLTPLHFATSPASRWAALFDETVLDAHLDALARAQAADGGWQIDWETTGPAAVGEWRGIETVRALRTLRGFGRLG